MKGQITAAKILMQKLRLEDSDAVVLGFSPGSEGHVSRMALPEWRAMMAHLNSLDPEFAGAERMRRKMIAMAYECYGVGKNESDARKAMAIRGLDAWCKKYGYMHKALNSYNYKELPDLVTQYGKVYKTLLKAV